ncbi:MAG: DUF2306 domain-containing protein [Pararhodobacter sp.]
MPPSATHSLLPPLPRAFIWFLWVGALAVALSSLRFLVLPMELVMEHMAHYQPVAPLSLHTHMLAGPLALALTPFQLWQGLRARNPALHRLIGRVYALAVLVAALSSLGLVVHFQGAPAAALGFVVSALLWIATTARGIMLARAGDYLGHRRWMLHSVALCFAAVTLRLIMAPLMGAGWTVLETYLITAWAGWLPNMLLVEWWLRRHAASSAPLRA